MPDKKPRFSIQQHEDLSYELRSIRDRLIGVIEDLAKQYPADIYGGAKSALEAVDALRIKMVGEIYKEHFPDDKVSLKDVYFRAGDYTHDPKPIYPLRVVRK